MLDPVLIQDVNQAWLDRASRSGGDSVQLPPFDVSREVIDGAFMATLAEEEGRPVDFTLAIADPDSASKLLNRHASQEALLTLSNPLLFSPESIVKLAPAFDSRVSALAVGRTAHSSALQIWGVFTFSPPANRFTEVPVALIGRVGIRPAILTVASRGRGSLVFGRGGAQVGRLSSGAFAPAAPTPFTSRSLGRHLHELAKTHDLYSMFQNEYWLNYRDALEALLSEASTRGHGATIVLIPQVIAASSRAHWQARHTFDKSFGLGALLRETLTESKGRTTDAILTGVARRRLVAERIEALAQLAVIDGALVLSDEMDVISFGAILKAPTWSGSVVTGPDGWGREAGSGFRYENLGTRHQSAIAFAGQCAGSVVFVISSDGPIRAFHSESQGVLSCWPDCTLSMFIDR